MIDKIIEVVIIIVTIVSFVVRNEYMNSFDSLEFVSIIKVNMVGLIIVPKLRSKKVFVRNNTITMV